MCFTPCPPNAALNTTDLTCVPIPAAVNQTLSDLGLTGLNITDVFIVEESASLENTLGFLATLPPGSTVVITVNPGVYPAYPVDLDINLIIVGVPEEEDRRLLGMTHLGSRRQLQTTGPTIIYAADNTRHFSTTRLLSLSGVILQGSLNSAAISGGVQLTVRGWGEEGVQNTKGAVWSTSFNRFRAHTYSIQQGPTALGSFTNVRFRDCRWSPNGGAVAQTGGASSIFSGINTVVDSCRATGLVVASTQAGATSRFGSECAACCG